MQQINLVNVLSNFPSHHKFHFNGFIVNISNFLPPPSTRDFFCFTFAFGSHSRCKFRAPRCFLAQLRMITETLCGRMSCFCMEWVHNREQMTWSLERMKLRRDMWVWWSNSHHLFLRYGNNLWRRHQQFHATWRARMWRKKCCEKIQFSTRNFTLEEKKTFVKLFLPSPKAFKCKNRRWVSSQIGKVFIEIESSRLLVAPGNTISSNLRHRISATLQPLCNHSIILRAFSIGIAYHAKLL